MRTFPSVQAISEVACLDLYHLPITPVQIAPLFNLVNANMTDKTTSYATTIPDGVMSKYFDQEAERHRLLLNDFYQNDIEEMRSMDDTKLIDNLQYLENLLTIFKHMLPCF